MTGKVFVTDGRSLAALAIVRSLGRKGLEIHCGEDFRQNLTFYSKYAKKKIKYSPPKKQPEIFIKDMLSSAIKTNYDLIIPVRDDTTLLLSKHKDEFEEYTQLFLADYETIKMLMDKGETIRLARKYKIATPETYFPEDTAPNRIKKEVNYPVLIRPRISSGARGIIYVESIEGFEKAYSAVCNEYGVPIIQEYVSHKGGHYSIGALFDENSRPIAVHVYRELKQYPINGGPAVTAISVKKEKWVEDMLDMLQKIHWIGPAHMDVLHDPNSGTYKLLEVNPRFWMSLNLSICSGLDFPYFLYKMAMAETIGEMSEFKIGMKYRWVLPNEILWLTQTPDKIRGLKEFLNFWEEDTCYGVLSLEDPSPAIGVLLQSAAFLLDAEKRSSIFKRGWHDEPKEK